VYFKHPTSTPAQAPCRPAAAQSSQERHALHTMLLNWSCQLSLSGAVRACSSSATPPTTPWRRTAPPWWRGWRAAASTSTTPTRFGLGVLCAVPGVAPVARAEVAQCWGGPRPGPAPHASLTVYVCKCRWACPWAGWCFVPRGWNECRRATTCGDAHWLPGKDLHSAIHSNLGREPCAVHSCAPVARFGTDHAMFGCRHGFMWQLGCLMIPCCDGLQR
jgi:hypothetical protein